MLQDQFIEGWENSCDESYQSYSPPNLTYINNRLVGDDEYISTQIKYSNFESKKDSNFHDNEHQFGTCYPEDDVDQSQRVDFEDSGPQFIPYESEHSKSPKIPKKIKKNSNDSIYMLPGESKNIPKNFVRSLKSFIIENFPDLCQKDMELKKFLNLKPEKACKQSLQKALKSKVMKQIARMFFGQKCWSQQFLKENKVDLEPYFRFNNLWI